jgi:DNA-binding transcriptional ArsR family regulator
MARIRTIKPQFFTSETIASIPNRDARLTFVGLWTHCDDEGRCIDNPRLIKAAVWPLDDDVTPEVVDEHLEMHEERGLIIRYRVGRQRLVQVTNWLEHQTINRPKPSKLPAYENAA